MEKFDIAPNAYYSFKKNRKAEYHSHKNEVKAAISNIYHEHGGIDGYRTIHAYLIRQGYSISSRTVHKYMNVELQLISIARKRKPDYEYAIPHKVFENRDYEEKSVNKIFYDNDRRKA